MQENVKYTFVIYTLPRILWLFRILNETPNTQLMSFKYHNFASKEEKLYTKTQLKKLKKNDKELVMRCGQSIKIKIKIK